MQHGKMGTALGALSSSTPLCICMSVFFFSFFQLMCRPICLDVVVIMREVCFF